MTKETNKSVSVQRIHMALPLESLAQHQWHTVVRPGPSAACVSRLWLLSPKCPRCNDEKCASSLVHCPLPVLQDAVETPDAPKSL